MRYVFSSLKCHRQMGQLLLASSQLRVQGSQKLCVHGSWIWRAPAGQPSMQIWQSSHPSFAAFCYTSRSLIAEVKVMVNWTWLCCKHHKAGPDCHFSWTVLWHHVHDAACAAGRQSIEHWFPPVGQAEDKGCKSYRW